MCFTPDSRPPIPRIAGGALDSSELTLTSSDGNRFMAFGARAAAPTGAGIVVLPDVRGLHAYYRDLALRFAEAGVDALAIDFFGRTAYAGSRGADFEHMPHVEKTTFAGLTADVTAAAAHLRSAEGGEVRSLFTVGFCFGGRLAFVSATLGLDLAGVIGFYGVPLAGMEHRIVSYPGAPHSFFDRTYEEHAAASADAWRQVLSFIADRTASPPGDTG
jgi:carboxymethylenebutenolidase